MTFKTRVIPCLDVKRPPRARRPRLSFSPVGRRWPEGSDEGVCTPFNACAAPSSRCRDLLPAGEKEAGRARPFSGPTVLHRAARANAQPRNGEDMQNENMEAVL
jgi:hypothetical protein